MKNALLLLAYSNVLIALNGAGLALVVLLLSGAPISFAALMLPVCIVFSVYTFDKVARLDPQDGINDPGRYAFILRYRPVLLACATVAFVCGAVVAIVSGWLAALLYLSPVLVAVLYSVPIAPARYRYRGLKDITYVKSVIVALSWGLSATLLPVVVAGGLQHQRWQFDVQPGWPIAVLVSIWAALRIFINTVYFDLGDLEGDRQEGTVTIAVSLGFARTRRLLHIINLATGAAILVCTELGWLPPIAHVLNLGTVYAAFYLMHARDESTDMGFTCDVVVESELALSAALLVACALATNVLSS